MPLDEYANDACRDWVDGVLGAEGKLAPSKIEDYTHACRKCGACDALSRVCRVALAEESLDRINRIYRIKKGME